MAGPDLSQFGSASEAAPVDLSAFGAETLAAAPRPAPRRGVFDGIADAIGSIYAPGSLALAQSVPGQAAFARSVVAGVPGMASKAVQGLGSAVDAADRLMMSPEEREAFDFGQRTLGPAPSFSGTVAPVAKVARATRNAIAPKAQTRGDQIGENIGGMAGLVGAAAVAPVLGVATFGATGAQDVQDDAARLGLAGTPRADAAVLGNAGAQSVLGALAPQAIAGRFVPQIGKTFAGRLLSSVGGNALLGATMPLAENAIVASTYDPSRKLGQGVPESAAQMAILGGLTHIAGAHGDAPSPAPERAAGPDLSPFGRPANDIASEARLTPNEATVADALADEPPFGPAPSPVPRPAASPSAPDITDQALDVLRSGGRVRVDQGPSLVEFLARNGGVQDSAGELAAMDADRWHRDQPFRPRLVQPEGRSLEDAAQSAYDAGYFPELPPPRMEGGESTQPVSPDLLLSSIRDELFGKPRFAREDASNSLLAQHVEDLDQITQELGLDPAKLTNAQIRSAIDAYFRTPDRRFGMRVGRPDPNQLGFDGFGASDPTREAIAAELRRRDAARGTEGAPQGGLFDPVARAQPGLFDRPLSPDNGALPRPMVPQTEPVAPAAASDPPPSKLGVVASPTGADALRQARDARLAERLGMRQAIDLSAYGDQMRAAGQVNTGLREAPRPGAIPAADPLNVAHLDETISTMAQRLRQALGLTHRQGRLTLRGGAVGEFDPKTSVIRTKSVQELDVLSHEATHALEDKNLPALNAAIKAHEVELKTLAYPGAAPNVLRSEGFAEFGRWYLTNPDHARKVAPGFYPQFEAALRQDAPAVLRELQGIQSNYQALLRAPSAAVARSLVVQAVKPSPLKTAAADVERFGIRGAVDLWSNELYRRVFDDLHPLKQAVRHLLDAYTANTGKKLDLEASKNPYALARLSRGAYAKGHMDVMHGVTPYRGTKPEGPSIPDALYKAFGRRGWNERSYQDFGAYLASRRLVHEWARYEKGELGRPPDKLTRATHEQAIRDFEAAHPTWPEAAQMIYAWNNNLWKLEHDAGFITGELYLAGMKDHPDYVPLQRDMSDRGPQVGPAVNGNRKFAGGGRTFRGSTRDVINPIQSMMQRAYSLAALTARNDVMGALYDLGERVGRGSGAIVERIPAHQMKAIQVDAAEALESAARDAGLSKRDVTTLVETVNTALEGETKATLFRAGDINEKGEPIIYLWRGGVKIPLRLPDGKFGEDMFTALTGMNRQAKNLLVQIGALPSRALRLGVTTQPEFFFANYIRDQVAAWVLSDVGFKPIVSGARGIGAELAQGDLARLYNTVGGISGGANVASLDHARINRDIGALNRRGYKIRRFASFEGLIKASEISETGSRLGLFKLAYKQALKRGMSEYDAAVEAAFTARDVLDFDRRGSNMLSAIRTVTFLNASLQSLDKARRVLTAEGQGSRTLRNMVAPLFGRGAGAGVNATEKAQLALAAKAWAKIGALGVFGLALTAHYADDKEYQEISDYLRATHWMMKGPGGEWLAVPKPFELAALSNILERGYEAVAKKDPTAWGRLVQGLGEVLVPPHELTVLNVPFQIAANRSSQGVPIVPDHLRYSVAPELQFNAYTSQLSRKIGKAVGVSPAVIDYLITGYGGSWGRTFLSATDTALGGRQRFTAADPADMFIARRFIRDVTRSSASSKEFWDLTSQSGGKLTADVGTFRQLINDGQQTQAQSFLAKLSAPERAFVVVSVFGSGGDKKLQPVERASQAVSVISNLRRDLASGPIRGPQGGEITLTSAERTKADEALAYLSMAEMRNSLIAAGISGWAQKQPIPRSEALQRLYAVSPPVVATLNARMQLQGVIPPEQAADVERAWVQNRDRIADAANSPALPGLMVAKEFKGRAGAMRYMRTPPSKMPQLPPVSQGRAP